MAILNNVVQQEGKISRGLRIFHLLQGLEVGGLERAVLSLAEKMHNEHYVHSFICYDWYGKWASRAEAKGMKVLLAKRRPGIDLCFPFTLAHLLRREKPNILHLHNETALFYGVLAGKLARVPVIIYTEHDGIFPGKKLIIRLNQLLGLGLEQIVSVSAILRRRLIEEKNFSAKRTKVIAYGIDEDQFDKMPDRTTARRRLGLEPGHKVIGIVARLEPEKNHRMLLVAFKRVQEALPETRLLIVGSGSLEAELEAGSDQLGLRDKVLFLGDRQDINQILPALDVFVLCSVSEGLPLSILEAMGASKPIVATDVGGVSEAVQPNINGLLVKSNDVENFSEAIIRLLQDHRQAVQMGKKGREIFESDFTLGKMVESYRALYDDFMKARDLGKN